MLANIAVAVREMSKDNPSPDVVEEKTKEFLSALQVINCILTTNQSVLMLLKEIDRSLSEEIAYLSEVSTTHPHVGSIYGEEKVRNSPLVVMVTWYTRYIPYRIMS